MKTNKIEILAPCKLNLHLRVSSKRKDGFHDIESLFQLISVSDHIVVSLSKEKNTCDFRCEGMILPLENTVTRAVAIFREKTGFSGGLRIDLQKNIPTGAGLGGGSSDAASVLIALDSLAGTALGQTGLLELAAKIGSDVPFFLFGGAALVRGTGECIEPISGRTDLHGVLIWPGVHSSTSEAYALVDRWQAAGNDLSIQWPSLGEVASKYAGDPAEWSFENSFTAPIENVFPVVQEARLALLSEGAVVAGMSGSGSSVFGLFSNKQAAQRVWAKYSPLFAWTSPFLLLASPQMQ